MTFKNIVVSGVFTLLVVCSGCSYRFVEFKSPISTLKQENAPYTLYYSMASNSKAMRNYLRTIGRSLSDTSEEYTVTDVYYGNEIKNAKLILGGKYRNFFEFVVFERMGNKKKSTLVILNRTGLKHYTVTTKMMECQPKTLAELAQCLNS